MQQVQEKGNCGSLCTLFFSSFSGLHLLFCCFHLLYRQEHLKSYCDAVNVLLSHMTENARNTIRNTLAATGTPILLSFPCSLAFIFLPHLLHMQYSLSVSQHSLEEEFHSSSDTWEDIENLPATATATDAVSPSLENTDDEESRTFPLSSHVPPPEEQFGLPPFPPARRTEVLGKQEAKLNESIVSTLPNTSPDPVALSLVEERIEEVESPVKYSEARTLAMPNTPPIDEGRLGGGVSGYQSNF